jgi:hypothetical protein
MRALRCGLDLRDWRVQRADQFGTPPLHRGLAQPRQMRQALGRQIMDGLPHGGVQGAPGVGIGAAVGAARQRALQGQAIRRARHAQDRRGLGLGQAGGQA